MIMQHLLLKRPVGMLYIFPFIREIAPAWTREYLTVLPWAHYLLVPHQLENQQHQGSAHSNYLNPLSKPLGFLSPQTDNLFPLFPLFCLGLLFFYSFSAVPAVSAAS
ncbi:uncharacterized protein BO96DRAFT_10381 [Aspergillus niger CBS 101883]|uniref:uncharacterized protein n=1 Tax=Aspergillus lacticoffeatus (strain CBS 101883) TaxID=1450533 RepID=UPI000D7EC9E9|nr:uncharacterized protein BO96DRAFT_10381 [Aspergillus niger CBS 101883]PYH62258.1 hypothetical protein BO96DRAFT_10381 [Aspergillus niger CBS 101883]